MHIEIKVMNTECQNLNLENSTRLKMSQASQK